MRLPSAVPLLLLFPLFGEGSDRVTGGVASTVPTMAFSARS